jgi:hypothetical protein
VYIRTYLLKRVIPENEVSLEFRYMCQGLGKFQWVFFTFHFKINTMPLAKAVRRCAYCRFKEHMDSISNKYWANRRCCKTCMQARSKAAYAKKLLKKRKRQAEEVVLENDREEERKEDQVSFMYVCMYVCMYVYICMYVCTLAQAQNRENEAKSFRLLQNVRHTYTCMPACPRAFVNLCRSLYTFSLNCLFMILFA